MDFTKSNGVEAAVLVLFKGRADSGQLLFTRRSQQLRSHAGEVAFPGGKIEPCDLCIESAALRESSEEVGLNFESVAVRGKLKAQMTRREVIVQPVVAEVIGPLRLAPDGVEVESIKWIDIDFFRRDERVRTDIFQKGGCEYWAPVYKVDGYTIWGVTARILVDYLTIYSGFALPKTHNAPVLRHTL